MIDFIRYKLLLRLLPLLLLLTQALRLWAGSTDDAFTNPRKKADSIYIYKQVLNKAYRIALYPDAAQQVVFFSVTGMEGKIYQLSVFDMEGRLVKQSEIRNKQTTHIKDLEKGVYLFEVFSDDDRISNGQLTFR
ncbi:MAG TPA: T9SS type A sorting domain-containing protein [Flavitalea sp.]|nr:T9SS type A sorting domain-containing protein [Flavitalea sp.]